MYYLIIGVIVLADQLIKRGIASGMDLNSSIAVIDNIFHITYIQNRGAAFSMLEGHSTVLIVVPAVIIAGALIYMYRIRKSANKTFLWAISLICGGGLGNLIDRVAYGYVVDYLDFRVFPVFNLADICVCCGCGLLVIYVLFLDGKNGKRSSV